MSFQTHEHNGLIWLTSAYLCGDGLRHGFSTRTGGVSPAPWNSLNLGPGRGDGDGCLQENYRRLCAATGMDVSRIVLSRQVHEDNVRLVTADDAGKGLWRERDYTSVDAMICNEKNIPLVVFGADCGIILMCVTHKEDHAGHVTFKVQLLCLDVNIAGENIVQHDVLDKGSLIILLVMELLDVAK